MTRARVNAECTTIIETARCQQGIDYFWVRGEVALKFNTSFRSKYKRETKSKYLEGGVQQGGKSSLDLSGLKMGGMVRNPGGT